MLTGLYRLQSSPLDIAVIGGGIQGAGMAREAAMRGLSVALFEKGDFVSGTSSRTSGLIHGGIRYLEQGDFGLVREAVLERHALGQLAPHLVRPMPFLFPVYQKEGRGRLKVRLGMLLYDFLAGAKTVGQHRMLNAQEVLAEEPSLRAKGLVGAAEFYDCQMDDARLCLATLFSARELGAALFNYTEVTGLILNRGKVCGVRVKEQLTGARFDIHASVVVNAAGPWVDEVCRLEGRAYQRIKPSKGIHIVVPRLTELHAIVVSPERSRRIFFVIPWKGNTLVGTTDTYYNGDLNAVHAERDEVNWLLRETARVIPQARLTEDDVIARFAGIRPLLYAAPSPSNDMSREGNVEWTPGGMLALVGGKYTLFRATARKGVDAILKATPELSGHKRPRKELPICGGEMASLSAYQAEEIPAAQETYNVGKTLLTYLIGAYGTKYHDVLALTQSERVLLTPLTSEGYPILAEVVYAAQSEMAVRLTDFMCRRTSLSRGPFKQDANLIEQVAKQMGKTLGWDQNRLQEETKDYMEGVSGKRRRGG